MSYQSFLLSLSVIMVLLRMLLLPALKESCTIFYLTKHFIVKKYLNRTGGQGWGSSVMEHLPIVDKALLSTPNSKKGGKGAIPLLNLDLNPSVLLSPLSKLIKLLLHNLVLYMKPCLMVSNCF